MKIVEHNTETGEQTIREASTAEKKKLEQWIGDVETSTIERQTKRQTILDKLGLTEEEIAILLS